MVVVFRGSDKGIFFSLDAVLALTAAFVIVGSLGVYYTAAPELEYRDKHAEAEDLMSYLSNTEAEEVDGIEEYVNETDGETVLELIGSYWASGNRSETEDIINTVLENKTDRCWEMQFSDESIGSGCEDGDTVSVASRIASGYEAEKEPEGYIARGHLTDAESRLENSYAFFGGYVGDGNITTNITLKEKDVIQNVTMEMDAGGNFTLFINDEESGHYMPEEGILRADKWNIDEEHWDNFQEGENRLQFNFTGDNESISGGFIRVNYNLTDVYYTRTEPGVERYSFPGIEGIINLYDGLEIPGPVESLEGYLKYDSSADLFLNLGNVTVYETGDDPEITNQKMENKLDEGGMDYEAIGGETVPLRLGVKDLRDLPGIDADPDAVATTDVSGNMDARLHESEYHDKWEAAEDATELFLDIFENATKARAGLTAFNDEIYSYYPLTNDTEELRNELGEWDTGGPTCIGCGILKSTTSLMTREYPPHRDLKTVLENGSTWSFSTEHEEGWEEPGFDDSEWSRQSAPLGPGQGMDESDDYYFRTSFDYLPIEYRKPFLSLLSGGEVDVYINGEKVHSSWDVGEGKYWDEIRGRWDQTTGLWHPTGNRKITGEVSWYFGIEEDYHYRTNEKENGTLVSPWLENPDDGELTFSHWLDKGSDHTAVVDVDYGEGWELLEELESTGGQWENVYVDLEDSEEVRFRFRFDSEGEVNNEYEGWYVDTVSLGGFRSELISEDLMQDEGNVIAVHFKPDGEDASFDARISAGEYRYRSTVVLSGGDSNQPTEMDEGPYYEDYFDEEWEEGNEVHHTVEAACRAHMKHDITVHTVAFVDEDEETAIEEMEKAADCGGGEFYLVDPDELVEVYEQIAYDILEAAMEEQRVIPEERVEDRLYQESHINITYEEEVDSLGYGEVPLSFETDRFGGEVGERSQGGIYISEAARPLEARVTSYPSRFWTSLANITNDDVNKNFYNLSDYGEEYTELGDPHTVRIPVEYMDQGDNTVYIDTAREPGNYTGGSPHSRVIYDVAVNGSVGYGDSFENYEGGIVEVNLSTGETYEVQVGESSEACDYSEDALCDVVKRLLGKLDVNDDGKVDLRISEEDLEFDDTRIGGVPYLWGPGTFTMKVW